MNYDDFLKSMMGGAGGMYGGLDPNKMSGGEMQRQLELGRRQQQAMAQDQALANEALRRAMQGMQGRPPGPAYEPPVEYPGPLEGFPPAPRGFFWVELIPPVGMVVAFVLAVLMVL